MSIMLQQFIDVLRTRSPWLGTFAVTLDEVLTATRSSALADEGWRRYDPARVLDLLGDVSKLLDRCLGYRREYMELAGAAVGFALDEQHHEDTVRTSEALEASLWAARLRRVEAQEQGEVERTYGSLADPLAQGLRRSAQAASRLAEEALAGELRRAALVRRKWRAARAHQGRLVEQHKLPSHPLNFSERAARVLELIREDFFEAVQKAQASIEGLSRCYGIPRSEITDAEEPLDELIRWARKSIRDVEHIRVDEYETTVVVSVRRSIEYVAMYSGQLPDESKRGLTIGKPFAELMNGATVRLAILAEPMVVRPTDRLISVGASFVYPNPHQIASASLQNGVVALCPPGFDLGEGQPQEETWPWRRPTIRLNSVSLERPRAIDDWADPTLVQNTPAYGRWLIDVTWHDQGNRPDLNRAGLIDLLIWMRVRRRRDDRQDYKLYRAEPTPE
jgi:hypothetical protein